MRISPEAEDIFVASLMDRKVNTSNLLSFIRAPSIVFSFSPMNLEILETKMLKIFLLSLDRIGLWSNSSN